MKIAQPKSLSKFEELHQVVNDTATMGVFFARAYRILKDKNLAAEAVQSVIVTIYVDTDIGDVVDLRKYILICISNYCKKEYKKKKKRQYLDIYDISEEEPIRLNRAIELFPTLIALLRKKMTNKQFRAFGLWINLYQEKEIAEEMNMSVTAVSSLLCRAKKNAKTIAAEVSDLLDY